VGCRDVLVAVVVTVVISSGGFGATSPDARAQPAGAEGPGAPPAPSSAAVRDAVARARRAVDFGRPDEAIAALEDAYQATGAPSLLFELAELQFGLGHLDEARRLFARYLERNPAGSTRVKAERRLRALDLAQDKMGSPAKGPRASPTAAAGRSTAVPARELAARPATAANPRSGPGTPATPAAPAVSHWSGWPSQIPPASPTEALASPSLFAVASSPSSPPALNLSVAAINHDEPQEHARAVPRWVPWAGAGLTAALLAGAIVTGLSANSRYDELHGSCGAMSGGCSSGDVDDVRNKARVANVLWIASGAVALATGLAAYVVVREGDAAVRGHDRGLP